jgi:hypothetical protein
MNLVTPKAQAQLQLKVWPHIQMPDFDGRTQKRAVKLSNKSWNPPFRETALSVFQFRNG